MQAAARAHRAILLAASLAVTLTAWLWLVRGSSHHHGAFGIGTFVSAVVMWQAMIVAMMAPTTLNWLYAYAALVGQSEPRRTFRAVAAFVAGYFFVWLGYSIAGAALQLALQHAGLLHHGGALSSRPAGMVLIAAGVVFFTPLSRACLKHCRNPLSYFLTHWDQGPRGGFRFGLVHGINCVGCCWALMVTGFAMGVMNLAWMAALTLLMCVEKLAPHGDRITAVAAVALIVWGVALLL